MRFCTDKRPCSRPSSTQRNLLAGARLQQGRTHGPTARSRPWSASEKAQRSEAARGGRGGGKKGSAQKTGFAGLGQDALAFCLARASSTPAPLLGVCLYSGHTIPTIPNACAGGGSVRPCQIDWSWRRFALTPPPQPRIPSDRQTRAPTRAPARAYAPHT